MSDFANIGSTFLISSYSGAYLPPKDPWLDMVYIFIY